MTRRDKTGRKAAKTQRPRTLKRRNTPSSVAPDEVTDVARLTRERDVALEQLTATSDVLKIVSASPDDLERVFQSVLENATRICGAKFGTLYLSKDDGFYAAAFHNAPPAFVEARKNRPLRPDPDSTLSRVARTKQAAQVLDSRKREAYRKGDPFVVAGADLGGYRTIISVPMLNKDKLIGVISIYRQEVRPFTDKQVELVESFASQAVIAIENSRLLNELRKSLQQQTATADLLKVISISPGELEPVFNAMLENATRICDAKFGTLYLRETDLFRAVAVHNAPPAYVQARKGQQVRPPPDSALGQVATTHQVAQIDDAKKTKSYVEGNPYAVSAVELGGYRTIAAVPMLKDDELVGAILIYRQEVRPFSEKQIALLQNFAAQAVIAIENTRLLNELRESLQQQTATADVLKVISSSPGDLGPVFDTMLANAVHVCGANFGIMHRYDGGAFCNVAMHNVPPAFAEMRRSNPVIRPNPGTGLGRVERTKKVVQILDLKSEQTYRDRVPATVAMVELAGARTLLVVPMLKDDVLLGTIAIYRQEVRPFTDKQIELVENFSAQAVIAIENTRLLNELREIPSAADCNRRRSQGDQQLTG